MTSPPLPKIAFDVRHLTDALRRSGALGDGRVSAVAVESSRPTVLSHIIRLRLTYEGAASGAPDTLILKTGLPDRADPTWHAGRHEVAFYNQVASAMTGRTVPRCHEAAWEQATNAWHLLLEDLTQSHAIATVWPLPPSTAQCESIVMAWARFHAAWWDDPRLGNSVGEWTGDDAAAADLKRFAERYAQLRRPAWRSAAARAPCTVRAAHRCGPAPRRALPHAPQPHHRPWQLACVELPAAARRRTGRAAVRLGQLADRHRDGRSRLHAGDALVSGPPAPPRAAAARSLPRGPGGARRARLRPACARRGLSPVGAMADRAPRMAGRQQHPATDLVEQPGAHR